MAYQALYRVWRPQTFADVVGQTAITTTLKNALISGQTSHAYLFTGPRGTGKTSVAKILAKGLNCEHPINGEPDNTCAMCQAINDGSLTDVIEFDAASNNSVDEIRNIIDKVKYAPTQARVKVYIIDEVHMLSTGAFNALLKTLEEPPAHVVFILATTDPQKVPATIISRTQRFNFRRITADDLVERMAYILDDKGVSYDKAALQIIARAAEGGMRDALSILDQVLSFGDGTVTVENALNITGGVDATTIGTFLTAVRDLETAKALEAIETLIDGGKDAGRLIDGVIAYLRDLLVFQAAPELLAESSNNLLDEHFKDLAQSVEADKLTAMINLLSETQTQLRRTNAPALYLEVATVSLTEVMRSPQTSTNAPVQAEDGALRAQVAELQKEVAQLSKQLAQGAGNGAKQVPQKKKPAAHKDAERRRRDQKKQVFPVLATATREDLAAVRDIWPDLLSMLSTTKRAMMNVSEPVAASADAVIVSFEYDIYIDLAQNDNALLAELQTSLKTLMKTDKKIVLVKADTWPKLRQEYVDELKHHQKAPEAAAREPEEQTQPPVVSALTDLFGSEANIEIKND